MTDRRRRRKNAGGGFGFFPYNTVASYEQWSQELRLSGELDRFRWQLGAYYLDMTWNTFQSVQGALILGGTSDTQIVSTFGDIDSQNWSTFGQVEFDLSPQWTVIAGVRWSQDDKHIEMRRTYADVPEGVPETETFNIDNVAIPGRLGAIGLRQGSRVRGAVDRRHGKRKWAAPPRLFVA